MNRSTWSNKPDSETKTYIVDFEDVALTDGVYNGSDLSGTPKKEQAFGSEITNYYKDIISGKWTQLKGKAQATTPLAKSVKSQQENVLVQVTKPDTDYSMTFRFEKTASCWQLIRFDDHSL